MRRMSLVVRSSRGGRVESEHPVSAALVQDGAVRWAVGPDISSFWRSACKPLQLLTALGELSPGVVTELSEEDLAVGAASHSGQPHHVARVGSLLERFGIAEEELRCGAHWPVHEPSARQLRACRAIHNNCSGKHTFMLAACQARDWSRDYLPAEHPLQVRNRSTVERWGGAPVDIAVDGCGVPTFHTTLSSQARAFSRLAVEMNGDSLAGRIGRAMAAHPEYTSGDDRLDLAVVRQAREPLAAKVGAEGLFCIARPATGQGIAVKVHSGQEAALAVAVRAVLDEVAPGVMDGDWPWWTVRNVAGKVVGERRVGP
jgi:L-asparaginase II